MEPVSSPFFCSHHLSDTRLCFPSDMMLYFIPTLSGIEQEEVVTCNKVYSKVRFLPKTHDLRPIINLRRKAPRLVCLFGPSFIGVYNLVAFKFLVALLYSLITFIRFWDVGQWRTGSRL